MKMQFDYLGLALLNENLAIIANVFIATNAYALTHDKYDTQKWQDCRLFVWDGQIYLSSIKCYFQLRYRRRREPALESFLIRSRTSLEMGFV
jgi:hypothetical protein